ncbi:MAG: hypothetical protein V3S20_02640, partial [Dehalococcoidia bacterium]
GVPSSESHLILDVVAALDPEIAVLIIEHDMDVVFRFAKEITVLVQGAVFTQGTPAEIMNNERVRAVYCQHQRPAPATPREEGYVAGTSEEELCFPHWWHIDSPAGPTS